MGLTVVDVIYKQETCKTNVTGRPIIQCEFVNNAVKCSRFIYNSNIIPNQIGALMAKSNKCCMKQAKEGTVIIYSKFFWSSVNSACDNGSNYSTCCSKQSKLAKEVDDMAEKCQFKLISPPGVSMEIKPNDQKNDDMTSTAEVMSAPGDGGKCREATLKPTSKGAV